jgi:hypothetical protein
LKWYRKAADQGLGIAQSALGSLYRDGQGVPKDYEEAAKWYRKAAEQGIPVGQYYLGSAYWNGQGVPQDYVEAANWFRKAADHGVAMAQATLGFAYWNGEGVPQDYVQAYKWYNLAATRYPPYEEVNRQEAVKFRDYIGSQMSPRQIAEAQKLAREWRPQSPKIDPRLLGNRIALIERPTTTRSKIPSSPAGVALKKVGGTFVVPVEINGAITLDFTVDSGAADVSVPLDVYSTLMRKGTIKDSDVIGERTYVLADGSTSQSFTFVIRSLKVGDMVVENVIGGVGPMQGSLLLGQSFLERF